MIDKSRIYVRFKIVFIYSFSNERIQYLPLNCIEECVMYLPNLLLLNVHYVKKNTTKKFCHFSEFDTKQRILRGVYYQFMVFCSISQNMVEKHK